jgi:hypothetical protein
MTDLTEKPKTRLCEQCGAFGDMPHSWVEGDCVLRHRLTNERHLPKATAGHICGHCVSRHREQLAEIVELYATLGRVVLAGSVPDNTAEHGHTKKAPASPSPLRLDAWSLIHNDMLNDHILVDGRTEPAYLGAHLPDIPSLLASWAQAAYDAQEWTSTAPTTVTGATAALRAAADVIARQEWIDDYDAELGWMWRALRNAHGLTQPQALGRCLTVDCGGQVWPVEDNHPRCGRCGRRYGTLDLVRMKVHEKKTEKRETA